jgi:hypothetical protein
LFSIRHSLVLGRETQRESSRKDKSPGKVIAMQASHLAVYVCTTVYGDAESVPQLSLSRARARVLTLSLYLMSTELRICMSEEYRKMSLESALMVKCSTAFQHEQPVGRRELTCVTRDNAAVLTCFARTLVMAITCCWWRGASNVPMRLARSWEKF